ncbi:hypothetical protein [Sorangium sp. So ce381]|uniref:hypothetical protein n=1 Tax=Sorangium sp. So ce381 TaxID=3133307 RepID=UPI003F5B6917
MHREPPGEHLAQPARGDVGRGEVRGQLGRAEASRADGTLRRSDSPLARLRAKVPLDEGALRIIDAAP